MTGLSNENDRPRRTTALRRALARSVALAGLGSAVVMGGCDQGPEGPTGKTVVGPKGAMGVAGKSTASIAGVEPRLAYLHRTIDVLISGSGTHWSNVDVPTVDFGHGITLVGVVVASPTALVATIDVTPEAEIGLRNVQVTSGQGADEETAEYAGVFDVEPSLDVGFAGQAPLASRVQQGSIVQAQVFERDPATPFDPITENVSVSIGEGSPAHPASELLPQLPSPPYQGIFFLFADVHAKSGPRPIVATSGPLGAVVESSTASDFVQVDERPPVAIGLGTQTETFLVPNDSRLFAFDAADEHVVTFEVSSTDPMAAADVYILPPSGKFADGVGIDSIIPTGFPAPVHQVARLQALVPKPGPYYLVHRGFGPHAGYDFQIEVTTQTCGSVHLSGASVPGEIAAAGEADCYSFMANAGQHVALVLSGSGADTCGKTGTIQSELAVVDGDTGRVIAFNDDHGANRCAALSVDLKAQGNYYVRVSSSQHFAPKKTFHYSLGYQLQ